MDLALRIFCELQHLRIQQALLRYQVTPGPAMPEERVFLTAPKASHRYPHRYRCACGRVRRKADQRCGLCHRQHRSSRRHAA